MRMNEFSDIHFILMLLAFAMLFMLILVCIIVRLCVNIEHLYKMSLNQNEWLRSLNKSSDLHLKMWQLVYSKNEDRQKEPEK